MTATTLDTASASFAARAWLAGRLAPWRRLVGVACALCILDVVPAIGFAAGLALAVSAIPHGVSAAAPWLLLAVLSLLARGGLAWFTTIVASRAGRVFKRDVRSSVVRALFESRGVGPTGLVAAAEGAETLDGYVARFVTARAAASVSPLLIIAACAVASPVSAAILLGTLAPFAVGMALAGVAAASESRKQFAALDQLASRYLDRIRTLPVILAFQAQEATRASLAADCHRLVQRTSGVLRIAFLSSAVMEFFAALSVALVAVYCGFALLGLMPVPVPEALDLPRALFVLALAPEVYAPVRRLAAAYHECQAAEAAASSLATAPTERTNSARVRSPLVLSAPPEIRFERVSVRYPGGEEPISEFHLRLAPQEVVALMGPSGSGKSSLLHLLIGLAPLSSGMVLIDGTGLPSESGLAGAVAWAGQHPFVSPGSLGHNIALARPSASRREVMAAAAQAGFAGDLERELDERGGGLSGGERRRLGLARALLSDAPIVLLDEPTANLDVEAELLLLPILRRLTAGRTALIATHSDAVAALADRVVRL